MALHIFKKSKQEPKEEAVKKSPKRTESAMPSNPAAVPVQGGYVHLARPHITEKATTLANKNQYIFVVKPNATKKEIAKDVESKYGVKVLGTRIINVKSKKVRLGRIPGIKKGYKKAIVQIQAGQRIEVLPT